jgi:hypothetical protein
MAINAAKIGHDREQLESLQKVTETMENLTVFGGLDGVLSQVVKMR